MRCTPAEAVKRGVQRIRRPEWDKGTYLMLLLTFHVEEKRISRSPLSLLFDRPGQKAAGLRVPQPYNLGPEFDDEEGWEYYIGPLDLQDHLYPLQREITKPT